MKKIALLLVASAFTFAANAQDAAKPTVTATRVVAPAAQAPVATPAKAAQATVAPASATDKAPAAKLDPATTGGVIAVKHVCTPLCKDGKHTYAHGEKGHVCSLTCQNVDKAAPAPKK